jgi:hypothetical protein
MALQAGLRVPGTAVRPVLSLNWQETPTGVAKADPPLLGASVTRRTAREFVRLADAGREELALERSSDT